MHPIPHNPATKRGEKPRSALASPFREASVESFNGQRVQPCFTAARRFSISLSFQHLGCFKCTASLSFCVSNKNQRCCGITNFKLSMSKHEETLSSSDWIRSLTCHLFPIFFGLCMSKSPKAFDEFKRIPRVELYEFGTHGAVDQTSTASKN